METRLYFSSFELTPKRALNARSQGEKRRGVLLRSKEGGVACLQPWTELGNASLKEEVEALKAGSPLVLGKCALACLKQDGEARALGKSLFSGLSVPPSHLSGYLALFQECPLEEFAQKGFGTLKLKADTSNPRWGKEVLALSRSSSRPWRLRLDFNASLSAREALAFWQSLPEEVRQCVEFVEDPCPYESKSWAFLSTFMPLAFDWEGKPSELSFPSAFMPVCKPAQEDPAAFEKQKERVVFTSFMDHPVGQAWAAYEAAFWASRWRKPLPLCGLVTQHLYEKSSFSEALGPFSPVFSSGQGTGLGFDSLLEGLPWQKIEKFF